MFHSRARLFWTETLIIEDGESWPAGVFPLADEEQRLVGQQLVNGLYTSGYNMPAYLAQKQGKVAP